MDGLLSLERGEFVGRSRHKHFDPEAAEHPVDARGASRVSGLPAPLPGDLVGRNHGGHPRRPSGDRPVPLPDDPQHRLTPVNPTGVPFVAAALPRRDAHHVPSQGGGGAPAVAGATDRSSHWGAVAGTANRRGSVPTRVMLWGSELGGSDHEVEREARGGRLHPGPLCRWLGLCHAVHRQTVGDQCVDVGRDPPVVRAHLLPKR